MNPEHRCSKVELVEMETINGNWFALACAHWCVTGGSGIGVCSPALFSIQTENDESRVYTVG